MNKKTVEDINWTGKRVIVRCDFNVPLNDELEVTDDTRIRAALPTIQYLREHGAAVSLCSHLGRPSGEVDESLRMDPVADRLSELLEAPVEKLDDCVGPEVEAAVEANKAGGIILLENLRFHPGERANDPEFAQGLARLGDVYVNNAFGTCHRAHASMVGIAQHLPAVAGFLVDKEITFLGSAVENPEHPFVTILGGAKVSDKIGVIENLLDRVEALLIGGGMANTFFKAQGYDMGDSLVEDESVDVAARFLEQVGDKLHLPEDIVVADAFSADAEKKTMPVGDVDAGWSILDIGPETVEAFAERVQDAATVVWNGPMGVFELEPFAQGTFELAKALAASDATTIIGGGDSAAAVRQAGVADDITHISTGGGASLTFLEGKELPGIAALDDN
jgi:phosphoglycerate kinase